jgi:hypothetical protein
VLTPSATDKTLIPKIMAQKVSILMDKKASYSSFDGKKRKNCKVIILAVIATA